MNARAVASYGALFDDQEALATAIVELAHAGIPRADLALAARSPKTIAELADRFGTATIAAGAKETGVLADLARATGRSTAAPAAALHDALVARGIDAERATYFDGRLDAAHVLLLVPHFDDDARILEALVAAGADLGLTNGRGAFETIPLRRERVELVKHVVTENEVVVRTEVVVEHKVFEVELTSEVLVIERRDMSAAGTPVETTRIPLKHEAATLEKTLVVTAEVVVRTEQHVEATVLEAPVRYEILRVDDPTPTAVAEQP